MSFLLALLSIGCAPEVGSGAETGAVELDGVVAEAKGWEVVYNDTAGRTLSNGSRNTYRFYKYSGYYYDIWIVPLAGSCDVYGHYTTYPTTSSYQYTGGSDDEFTFTASSNGYYYLSVYGASSSPSCRYNLYVWRYS